jgi:hypothetical protein
MRCASDDVCSFIIHIELREGGSSVRLPIIEGDAYKITQVVHSQPKSLFT